MRFYSQQGQPVTSLNYDQEAAALIIRTLLDTEIEKRFDTLVVILKWAIEREDCWRFPSGGGTAEETT